MRNKFHLTQLRLGAANREIFNKLFAISVLVFRHDVNAWCVGAQSRAPDSDFLQVMTLPRLVSHGYKHIPGTPGGAADCETAV